jgi:hypothetical protein
MAATGMPAGNMAFTESKGGPSAGAADQSEKSGGVAGKDAGTSGVNSGQGWAQSPEYLEHVEQEKSYRERRGTI